jgi:hypothetical protein
LHHDKNLGVFDSVYSNRFSVSAMSATSFSASLLNIDPDDDRRHSTVDASAGKYGILRPESGIGLYFHHADIFAIGVMLAKDPADRIGSASELRKRLIPVLRACEGAAWLGKK